MMDHATLARFRHIISTHTGLVVPERDTPLLEEMLAKRLVLLPAEWGDAHTKAAHYLSLLESEGPASQEEWRALVLELTTGESYFFRDKGQMRLLREVILPELVKFQENKRQLRVWSAGCSTGEEPYTLAILIRQLLAFPTSWQILLKGTDINDHALQHARRGQYGRWAFRGVDEAVIARYFQRSREKWTLDPAIRQTVTFQKLNLIKDTFPDPSITLCDLDLIVCRNVFIYFGEDAIAGIMARFAASLRPGGYILTGHAEVQHPIAHLVTLNGLPLVTRSFPDSIIFQRPLQEEPPPPPRERPTRTPTVGPTSSSASPSPSPSRVPKPARKKTRPPPFSAAARAAGQRPPTGKRSPPPVAETDPLKEAHQWFAQGAYAKAIQRAEALLTELDVRFEAHLVLAKSHANLGESDKAEHHGREALRQKPVEAAPHFLLATLVHERGDLEQARDLLQKTLYLDRAHVPAYLQLATLHQEEGAEDRARQMRRAALDVLRDLPASDRVEHYEAWTVKELAAELEKQLDETPG